MFVRIEDKNLISPTTDDKNTRIQMLEQKVENLYAELNELREQFLQFKKEFIYRYRFVPENENSDHE